MTSDPDREAIAPGDERYYRTTLPVSDPDRLAAIHRPTRTTGKICDTCCQWWPCDASVLLSKVARLTALLDTTRRLWQEDLQRNE